jgi:hypothetical protein
MHPPRELTQFGAGRIDLRADVHERLTTVREQLRHASEPPLGTIAELALQPDALFV